ncbi:MAG: acyl-CoA dehydrogenase family protein [Calditrichaeota bacterium]|nr:acyl-CoA dehydrogenase family protein [Calditrichota bacterium]
MQSPFFTEHHEKFRKSIRQFLSVEVEPFVDEWEENHEFPRELWRKMGDRELLGLLIPESYGGIGSDFFYAVVLMEELVNTSLNGLAGAVSAHQMQALYLLYTAGSRALKEDFLIPGIRGDKIGALAVAEPHSGSDLHAIETRAERQGNYYRITGAKTFVTNGMRGDFLIVAAKTVSREGRDGITLILVETNAKGVERSRIEKEGWNCTDAAEITFDNVRVPVTHRIGQDNKGLQNLVEVNQLERIISAVMAAAGAKYCLKSTIRYLQRREESGRALANRQSMRHQLSDLAADVQSAEQLAYFAAWLQDLGEPAITQATLAKLKATECFRRTADACLQIFGANGFTGAYDILRMFRDSRLATVVNGHSELLREQIGQLIIDSVSDVDAENLPDPTPASENLPEEDADFAAPEAEILPETDAALPDEPEEMPAEEMPAEEQLPEELPELLQESGDSEGPEMAEEDPQIPQDPEIPEDAEQPEEDPVLPESNGVHDSSGDSAGHPSFWESPGRNGSDHGERHRNAAPESPDSKAVVKVIIEKETEEQPEIAGPELNVPQTVVTILPEQPAEEGAVPEANAPTPEEPSEIEDEEDVDQTEMLPDGPAEAPKDASEENSFISSGARDETMQIKVDIDELIRATESIDEISGIVEMDDPDDEPSRPAPARDNARNDIKISSRIPDGLLDDLEPDLFQVGKSGGDSLSLESRFDEAIDNGHYPESSAEPAPQAAKGAEGISHRNGEDKSHHHKDENLDGFLEVIPHSYRPTQVLEIFQGLPTRFRPEQAGNYSTVFHFRIRGSEGGEYTVNIKNGQCRVAKGLIGEPLCVVETSSKTYMDIELGYTNPQVAFMMGKVRVSSVPEMMQFAKVFGKLPNFEKTT